MIIFFFLLFFKNFLNEIIKNYLKIIFVKSNSFISIIVKYYFKNNIIKLPKIYYFKKTKSIKSNKYELIILFFL